MIRATICPTITADSLEDFQVQIERVSQYATRLHIDLSDGQFSPRALVPAADVWWPGGMRADLHVMLKQPWLEIDTFLALGPQLVIVHAEADGDFFALADTLHHHGIEVGIALLQETEVENIIPHLSSIDHVLVFSGNLGSFGGVADMTLLRKVSILKAAKATLEIGWDGGINTRNARELVQAGVDVLNVGGFIHKSTDPLAAYEQLQAAL